MERGFSQILILLFCAFLAGGILLLVNQNGISKTQLDTSPAPSDSPTPTSSPKESPPIPSIIPSPRPQSSAERKTSKILLLIYNPILENFGNKKLNSFKNWNNPISLTQSFINSVRTTSGGYLNYEIASQIEIDGYPIKADGFQYSDQTYLDCMNSSSSCHNPDLANYQKMITDSGACDKRNNGEIDELWIWGGPYFGYWESNLAGPGAYWYNSMPTTGTNCAKLLPVMGFNYERGEAEMFEDMGHRLESTMTKVYGSWVANTAHAWNRFALLDFDSPGNGGCGNSHLAVNAGSNQGYDRRNTRSVNSTCEDFLNYPNLTGRTSSVSCSSWGCNELGYFKWLFSHLPQKSGQSSGKLNNWWKYLAEPELAL